MRIRYLYDTLFFTGPSVVADEGLIDMPIGLQIPVAAILAFAVSWGLV